MKLTLSLALAGLMMPMMAFSANIIDEPNRKAVGHVTWQKSQVVDASLLAQQAVPHGLASLFFVRELGSASTQTSVNIAVNDRFQVSLQPAHFSQVNSCAGINDLSAQITGQKTNDLLYRAERVDLQNQGTYFFLVKVDGANNVIIEPMSHQNALNYISSNNLKYQSHQISRVVKDGCDAPLAPLSIIDGTPPPIEPIAKEPVSIELAVFFDTDKSFVKPQYYEEIGRVAHFMNAHPHVTAVIEGHTDSRADDAYNKALAKRRVEAVKMVLVNEHKIDEKRLSTASYGETRPIASNDTAEGRQKNRRVVATFSGY